MKAKAYSLSDPGGQGLDIVLLVCINTKIICYEANIFDFYATFQTKLKRVWHHLSFAESFVC